jgi:hypothetical protein
MEKGRANLVKLVMKVSEKTRREARPTAARVAQNQSSGKKKKKYESSRRRVSKSNNKARKKQRQARRSAVSQQRQRARGLDEKTLHKVSKSAFGEILHHKQVLSIALVTLSVIYCVKMTIHELGEAMVRARGRGFAKHGIKQVDRFMSNKKIKPVDLRRGLVWFVVGDRKQIEVTMDWTDFDKDDQTTLVISLVLKHGRAIPLVWLNERKSELKGRRSIHEHTAVQELREALTDDVKVTLLADRGFGDTKLFDHLQDIPGFDFIVRFRQGYALRFEGYAGKTGDAVYRNGRVRVLRDALLTRKKRGPYTVVLYKARKMKDSWCLATNLDTIDGKEIVVAYGRRFECEESFRDLKDWRFGLALKYTRIANELRRERLLFAFALAAFLLTLVGVVSEKLGLDRHLRANTVNYRTHSLFRQGREIVRGTLPDVLERECMHLVMLRLAAGLKKGMCHAFS